LRGTLPPGWQVITHLESRRRSAATSEGVVPINAVFEKLAGVEGRTHADWFCRGNHTFHIPVMGTGFTLDTPLRIARFGISSVISLVDDVLIEQVRRHYSNLFDMGYEAIGNDSEDCRAKRITAYLDLLHERLQIQMERLRSLALGTDGESDRYFRLLPAGPVRDAYEQFLACEDEGACERMGELLKACLVPGRIDVNIMTKLDCPEFRIKGEPDRYYNHAVAALRGFANSVVVGGVVFSAGMNPGLYNELTKYPAFRPQNGAQPTKAVILKVSDYRSAQIQGRQLARKGIWVSEFRIESGLNCGGHAFASPGLLLGPILEEFKANREELHARLWGDYCKALKKLDIAVTDRPFAQLVTAQGGIGTGAEDQLLREHFGVDATGWGTAFLFVPEATAMDDAHLAQLIAAGDEDVTLSSSSPLGVPFWWLNGCESDRNRLARIEAGAPGSFCGKGYLRFCDDCGDAPVCRASREYQSWKLAELDASEMSEDDIRQHRSNVLAKACICHELGGTILRDLGISERVAPAICPGPSTPRFKQVFELDQMVDNIYGRQALVEDSVAYNTFLLEAKVYIDYLIRGRSGVIEGSFIGDEGTDWVRFEANLRDGLEYYVGNSDAFFGALADDARTFLAAQAARLTTA
jgi:hypothetical protein